MPIINGFSGDYTGLSQTQVKEQLVIHGKNEFKKESRFRLFYCLVSTFKEPMFLLLFGAAGCYFLLGEPKDGIIMLIFVVFVAGINFFQEYRTDKTLEALKKLTSPQVEVVREGRLIQIDSSGLVPGDLMVMNEGERISADGRILECFDLGVDESILTGESEIVWKKISDANEKSDSHWKTNYLYAGTTVIYGTAIIEVTATAFQTEYGKISKSIQEVKSPKTPLEKEIGKLIKYSALIGLSCCLLCIVIDFIIRGHLINAILSGVTLAMSVIPEELPVILTVFMAIGAWKLARINALMRKIPAVETLGAISVLCSDKTGTLTQNQMDLEYVIPADRKTESELLRVAVLASESAPTDPMEQAVQKKAELQGLSVNELLNHSLIHEYPFSSDSRMMGHVWEIDGVINRCIKGSPESILPLCTLTEAEKSAIIKKQNELMSHGDRVIAVAELNNGTEVAPEITGHQYFFTGLLGFIDPPRPETSDAIATARKAGIRVVMITGDHALTAKSIASRIGIDAGMQVITGIDLDAMSDGELDDKIDHISIFARVMPHHKLRIVSALQRRKNVVAMTGDGVNDAPALKASDIGVAMGKRGTEVAREAADMILLDDNFSTIVHSIEDGRRIYDNIRKAIGYVFVIHIPIALLALFNPIIYGKLLLLLPIHVLLLELVIDPTCSIVFERMQPEPGLMERPPRKYGESLISLNILGKAIIQGLVIFFGIFGTIYFFYLQNVPVEIARSFTLLTLILSNFLLVYVNASETRSAFRSLLEWEDKTVWTINIMVIILPLILIYTGFGNNIVKTAPLPWSYLFFSVGLATGLGLWYDLFKCFKPPDEKQLLMDFQEIR